MTNYNYTRQQGHYKKIQARHIRPGHIITVRSTKTVYIVRRIFFQQGQKVATLQVIRPGTSALLQAGHKKDFPCEFIYDQLIRNNWTKKRQIYTAPDKSPEPENDEDNRAPEKEIIII